MSQPAPIEPLIAVTPKQALGSDIFCNASPITIHEGGARTVFGGVHVGQAIAAANETVSPHFAVYSSHSSFVRAASGRHEVNYHVERVSESRAYATRIVRAYESASKDSSAIYVAVINYQSTELPTHNVLDYNSPLPDMDGLKPEDISKDVLKQVMTANVDKSASVVQMSTDTEPFDWRPCGFEADEDPSKFRMYGFVRSSAFSTDKAGVHLAAMGYLSDEYSVGATMYANPAKCGRTLRKIGLAVSLNHAVSFHEPSARADEWMMIERQTYWGANGRAVIHQKIWNKETGRLVMSGTQEALYRLKDQTSTKI